MCHSWRKSFRFAELVGQDKNMFQLRRLQYEDVEWIFDACQDETIQRWTLIPRPYSLEDAEWFVENAPASAGDAQLAGLLAMGWTGFWASGGVFQI